MWGPVITDEEASSVFEESPSLKLLTPGIFGFFYITTLLHVFIQQKRKENRETKKKAGRIKALLLRPNIDCFGGAFCDASAGSCGCRNRRRRNKKSFIFCF